jgi:arsenite-transporting ATPase
VSNQARLVLLSGTGGSGTTTLVDATMASAREEGLVAVAVDAVRPQVEPAAWSSAQALRAALVGWLDADAMPPENGMALGPVRHWAAWERIVASIEEPGVDVVIADCGSLREARDLIEFPALARRLLDAALTPSLAMRSQAPADAASAARAAFDVVAEVRDRAGSFADLVESPATTMRLVTVPEPTQVTRTLRAQAGFAMSGVQVEAIIINRFARKADGVGREAIAMQQAQLERAALEAQGSWVWKSTSVLRPLPKDRSATGPFGGVAVLRAAELQPTAGDEAFSLLLPLIGEAVWQARVGRAEDHLVVEFDGSHRWLPLPAVLRRCRTVDATRTADGLLVTFVPDEALWRRRPDPEQAA